jgi:hypothetical protein
MGSGVTGGGGGSTGQGLRVDTTALAGGGWQRRGKAVKAAAAAAGGDYLDGCEEDLLFIFFARREASGYWRGHATSTSYHYRHTILWSY